MPDARRESRPEGPAMPPMSAADWYALGQRTGRVLRDHFAHLDKDPTAFEGMMRMNATFARAASHLASDPARLVAAQSALWRGQLDLWRATAARLSGGEARPQVEPASDDRRFRHEAWTRQAVFDHLKQSYLLAANWLQDLMGGIEGLDPAEKRKLDVHTRFFVDALSPTNFALTNPEVIETTVATRGDNLIRGLQNLLDDLERGKGRLDIRMVDESAFEVGGNLAVTPGKVVYRNELMQLLQYSPATDKVRRRPLLIVPPWINKFYILDLRPENSLLRWLVERGYTVFCISWVNPDAELASRTFDDYARRGPLEALDAIRAATGARQANALGYCIGGTLLAATLAHMAHKQDRRIGAATFLTTLTDFEDAGDIEVFVDDEQVDSLERVMAKRGYLDGWRMASTFNALRANDLVWSFVIDNYLLGKEPFPFDILYWNSDSTRLPAAMHAFYLRRMYLENALARPGAMELLGTPLDLGRIEVPAYLLSTLEDHIAPWESTYKATRLFGGESRFTLAMSGHVAGVVNPPARNKYGYWTREDRPAGAQDWLAGADRRDGSWWPHWEAWLRRRSGGLVPAREPGAGGLDAIEDAPGSYVGVRLRDRAR